MRLIALLLLFLVLVVPILSALPPIVLGSHITRKVGPWVDLGAEGSQWTPYQLVQNIYLTKPYYAYSDYPIMGQVVDNRLPRLDKMIAVLTEFQNARQSNSDLSVVEITITLAFDVCSETDYVETNFGGMLMGGWNRFGQFVTTLAPYAQSRGGPVAGVGIWGEFTMCQGDAWFRISSFDSTRQQQAYDRAISIVQSAGLQAYHEGIYRWNSRDNSEQLAGAINWPVWQSEGPEVWGGVKYSCPTSSEGTGWCPVGHNFGMKAWDTTNGGHPWQQSDVQAAFSFWNGQPDNIRYLIPMGAAGSGCSNPDQYASGACSVEYGTAGREWIWQEQQKYPEFVWVGKSSVPAGLSTSFTYTPSSTSSGVTITFTSSATGGTQPYAFSWNFADGGVATGDSVTHVYSQEGLYTVTLTTTDGNSQTATVSRTIPISAASTFLVSFTWSPANPLPGQLITFTGSATGGASPYEFHWHFGDGGQADGNPATHSFSSAGAYSVTLETADTIGKTTIATQSVIIGGVSPPPSPPPIGPGEILVDLFGNLDPRNPFNLMMLLTVSTLAGLAFGVFVAKRRLREFRPIILRDRS